MDGSAPDPPGVFWLPAAAVGEGDDPGDDDAPDGMEVAVAVAVAACGVAVADCDAEADGPGDDANGVVVAGGVALSARIADGDRLEVA